jgi:predicted tellurium resistance membrane protein TerC
VWKFGATTGKQIGVEFLTGYVVEWSLSLDNMFVFVLAFRYFGTPARLQHRILFYGILGALIFRGVFVVLGAELLQYGWVVTLVPQPVVIKFPLVSNISRLMLSVNSSASPSS